MSDYCLIPVLSSQAGSCLTLQNWQQAGATHGVYYLEALLTKPGIKVLQDFSDLRSYTAWPGTIILNACLTAVLATGDYAVRSPYDGSIIIISEQDICALISHLQADYVIWPTSIVDDAIARDAKFKFLVPGINHLADGASLFYWVVQENIDEVKPLEMPLKMPLEKYGSALSTWVESDQPAADALQGNIYNRQRNFNLLELRYREEFLPLDEACCCFTCQEGYTRAYLHHLLQQTPLLAQRFLILHNYSFCSYHLKNEENQSSHLPDSKFSL